LSFTQCPHHSFKLYFQSNAGGDLIGKQVLFQNGQVGVVVTHRAPIVFVYTDMESFEDTASGTVKVLDSFASVGVKETIKSVDCFGRSTKPSEKLGEDTAKRAIFSPIPQVKDIALINSPLITGVTMFDALAPIGKGQNMLLIGNDVSDMRGYVCDFLSSQSKKTRCIYAATSGKEEVTKLLEDYGVLEDIIVVSEETNKDADEVSQAAEATVVAATACAIAESFALEKGEDTLVIIDNIDQHKKLWDATTRVLVDVFGVDAVVKGDRDGGASSEMRAFFSSLVQRSAQFNRKKGGGSVTLLLLTTIPKILGVGKDAEFSPEDFKESPDKVKERLDLLVKRNVPLTASNLRKIQIPVPSASEGLRRLSLQHVDDLISMSDGQIWLDEELKEGGRLPAMNFQRSVTRIGIGADTQSRADAAAVRRVVEGLRLDLSQAEYMDGADVESKASVKQIQNARAWLLAMHQPPASGGRLLSESCAILLAASKGYLGGSVNDGKVAGTKEGEKLVNSLIEYIKTNAASAMKEIDSSQDLTSSAGDDIEDAIKSFFA
jgi:F-type H+-transporting ATPase subunit alpha